MRSNTGLWASQQGYGGQQATNWAANPAAGLQGENRGLLSGGCVEEHTLSLCAPPLRAEHRASPCAQWNTNAALTARPTLPRHGRGLGQPAARHHDLRH
jgi:hypothetical protein